MCPIDGFATVMVEAVELPTLTPGKFLFGRFIIESFVEQDGAVANYRARNGDTVVRVAVAALPEVGPSSGADDDPVGAEVQRMLRAAQALERLHHPNVAQVMASGMTDDGLLAIVSEHITGPSLAESLRAGPIGSERAMEIGLGILTALEAAHAQGLTHHDLAPARVRFAADGHVVLTDLGYADLLRAPDAHFDERPTLSRGAPYRAPEQARARAVTRHADIYSVGAMLFEMLTGQVSGGGSVGQATPATLRTALPIAVTSPLPFAPEAASAPRAGDLRSEPDRAPPAMQGVAGSAMDLLQACGVEAPLADFVARCLEKKPWNRYDNATLARQALEAARDAVERAGPIGQARLGEMAWEAPRPELATRESTRPDPGASGLLNLGSWAASEREASRPAAVIEAAAPVAPIARPMVQYVRPRRQAWWVAAAAVGLVAGGIGIALLFMSGRDEPAREVAAVGVELAPTSESLTAATARQVREAAARDVEAKATAEREAKAKLANDAKAKIESDARAKAEAEARAKAESEAKAEAEAPLVLDAVGPEDGALVAVNSQADAKPTPVAQTWAEKRAAEVAAAQEQARLRLEAATKARLEREKKETETARAAAAAREARDAAWKLKVEAVEREQKQLEAQRKAELDARREARLAAAAEKAAAASEAAEAERQAKAARTAKPTPEAPATPIDPSLHRAQLATVPAGASVLVDGTLIGKTPLMLTWKPGAVKHVWVMLEGHLPTSFDLSDSKNTKNLRLELVESAPEKPEAATAPEDP